METPYPIPAPAPVVKNHFVGALLTTLFCCMPLGVIGIIYAVQVDAALMRHDAEAAAYFSKKAKFWYVLGLGIGATLWTLYILVYAVLIFLSLQEHLPE